MLRWAVAAIAWATLSAAPAAAEGEVGVLVGLAGQGSKLRTVWLPAAGGAEPLQLTPLIVPRRDGFWRLGLVDTCGQEDTGLFGEPHWSAETAQYIWAAPINQRARIALREAYERRAPCHFRKEISCTGEISVTLGWVWPDLVSLQEHWYGDCGAHPDGGPIPNARSLDDVAGKGLAIGRVLGGAAEKKLRAAFLAKSRRENEGCAEEDQPDRTYWMITRDKGRWSIDAFARGHRVVCGPGFDYHVDLPVPAALDRAAAPAVTAEVQRALPGTTDVFAGPGDVVLVVGPRSLAVVPAAAPATAPLARAATGADERVIMVEWANASQVGEWTAALRDLASHPDEGPRLARPR